MNNKIDIDILKKSLKFLAEFPKYLNISASEYIKVHLRNKKMIEDLIKDRKSKLLTKKLSEYPDISEDEIEEFINWKQKNISIYQLVLGKVFGSIFDFIKLKGRTKKEIQKKILKISEINNSIYNVIENPDIEKLIEQIK